MCTNAYTQAGYDIEQCSAANTPSGTSCSVSTSCAAGFVGTPAGSVSCTAGAYVGAFTGCSCPLGTFSLLESDGSSVCATGQVDLCAVGGAFGLAVNSGREVLLWGELFEGQVGSMLCPHWQHGFLVCSTFRCGLF